MHKLQKINHLKLQKGYNKILQLCPALNETFVLLVISNKQYQIVHINQYGQIITCYKIIHPISKLKIIQQTKVMYVNPRNDKIHIIYLETNKQTQYTHLFINKQYDRTMIEIFSSTKLIAIIQKGHYNQIFIRITYYRIEKDKFNQNLQKITQFINQDCWKNQYQIMKANQHSMIVWFAKSCHSLINFHYYCLKIKKVQTHNIKISNFSKFIDQKSWETMILTKMRQLSQGKFFLGTINTNLLNKSLNIGHHYDLASESLQKIQIPILLQQQLSYILDIIPLSNSYIIHANCRNQEECILMDKISNEIIGVMPVEDTYNVKRLQCAIDGEDLFFQYYFQSPYHNRIKVVQIQYFQYKNLTLHLLLSINPQFDQDLLMDVITNMDYP